VVCFGLYIDEIFHPLYFDFVKKKEEGTKNEAIEVVKTDISHPNFSNPVFNNKLIISYLNRKYGFL
jgi:hypothetical protein